MSVKTSILPPNAKNSTKPARNTQKSEEGICDIRAYCTFAQIPAKWSEGFALLRKILPKCRNGSHFCADSGQNVEAHIFAQNYQRFEFLRAPFLCEICPKIASELPGAFDANLPLKISHLEHFHERRFFRNCKLICNQNVEGARTLDHFQKGRFFQNCIPNVDRVRTCAHGFFFICPLREGV